MNSSNKPTFQGYQIVYPDRQRRAGKDVFLSGQGTFTSDQTQAFICQAPLEARLLAQKFNAYDVKTHLPATVVEVEVEFPSTPKITTLGQVLEAD